MKSDKKEPFENYDFDEMSPLTGEQAATFRPVTKEEHEKFSSYSSKPKKKPLANALSFLYLCRLLRGKK
jgi:hypothetical protein